tara:strand:+ start:6817 stop:7086 length:270 start_codon:yes stop_codon:yes gene_type:complete
MPAQLLEGPYTASQGSLKGLGMAFDISLNLQLTNCSDDEAANDELCRLIDYCEARMHKVTPSVVMQALAEAIVGMDETESLWVDRNSMN